MKRSAATTAFLAVLGLALAARLIGLDRVFVLDELRTIRFSNMPLPGLLGHLAPESYPPFTYLLMSFWMRLSTLAVWIRMPFVIFGIASVVVFYIIGRELIDKTFGLLVMFLAALMPMQVWISQYVRGIAPCIFFMLLSTRYFLRLTKAPARDRNAADIAGYVASTVLSIYSFYFSFFVIFAQNIIYCVGKRRDGASLFRWAALQALLGISFLPWLGGFCAQMRGANVAMNFSVMNNPGLTAGGFRIGLFMRALSGLLGLDQAFLANTAVTKHMPPPAITAIPVLFLLALIVLVYGLIRLWRRAAKEKVEIIFFLVFAVIPYLCAAALNIALKTPITPRYFALSSAFMIFVYAYALYGMRSKKARNIILVLVAVLGCARLADFSRTAIDYRGAARFVGASIRDGECLLFIGGDAAYRYYAAAPGAVIPSDDYIRSYTTGMDYSLSSLIDRDRLGDRLRPFKTVWIYTSGEKGVGIVRHVLGLVGSFGYNETGRWPFKDLEVLKYEKIQ